MRGGVTVFEQVHVSPRETCTRDIQRDMHARHARASPRLLVMRHMLILSYVDMLKEDKTDHDDNTPDVRTRR